MSVCTDQTYQGRSARVEGQPRPMGVHASCASPPQSAALPTGSTSAQTWARAAVCPTASAMGLWQVVHAAQGVGCFRLPTATPAPHPMAIATAPQQRSARSKSAIRPCCHGRPLRGLSQAAVAQSGGRSVTITHGVCPSVPATGTVQATGEPLTQRTRSLHCSSAPASTCPGG